MRKRKLYVPGLEILHPRQLGGGLRPIPADGGAEKMCIRDRPGATASATAAAGSTVLLSFPSLVRQACCAAGSSLTIVLTGAASTVNNVALRVQRI